MSSPFSLQLSQNIPLPSCQLFLGMSGRWIYHHCTVTCTWSPIGWWIFLPELLLLLLWCRHQDPPEAIGYDHFSEWTSPRGWCYYAIWLGLHHDHHLIVKRHLSGHLKLHCFPSQVGQCKLNYEHKKKRISNYWWNSFRLILAYYLHALQCMTKNCQ